MPIWSAENCAALVRNLPGRPATCLANNAAVLRISLALNGNSGTIEDELLAAFSLALVCRGVTFFLPFCVLDTLIPIVLCSVLFSLVEALFSRSDSVADGSLEENSVAKR